jgi:hypothetical protein
MHDQKSEKDAPRGNDSARRPRHHLGHDGLTYFKALIGGPPQGWTVEKVALRGPALDFSLVKASNRLELHLTRDSAAGIRLSARGDRKDLPDDERLLMDAISAGLAKTGFADLLARLNRDALLYSDSDGGSVPSRFECYYRVVNHTPHFWKFVYPEVRFLEQEVRFGARYAQISHATLECNLNNPRLEVAPLRFFADDTRPRAKEGSYSYTDTDIGEADVVGGRTQEILGRTLERVAREEKPAFIHLKTTCLPELVGDTPIPFVARIEKELGVPVLWTSKTHNSGPVYEAMVERLLGEVPFASVRDPKAVLLAGLSSEEGQAEAVELCRKLGLRVVGTLFPNLDFRESPEIGVASAVIWYNPVGWAKISDDVFLRRGLRVVRYHPPFGLSGTRGWISRIVSVLGLPASADAEALSMEPLKAELEALSLECRRRTVALAGDMADIELLTSSGRAFGFSVAGMLCDLGFNVRCLVWSPKPGATANALRRPKAPLGAGTIEFIPFSSSAQLDRALGRGIDLVFSHFNHDPRLEAHGLQGFNDNAFAPGLEGLIRTGRGLLMKCAARPFPRHRAHLTPWKI